MLRIRQKKWGYWLFDLWVVVFTIVTLWALHDAEEANSHTSRVVKTNRHLIAENHKISARTDRQICIRINNLNATISGVLYRSKTNIPKLQYYKDNPEDLQAALKQINEQITKFRPRVCGKEVK